MRSRTNRLSLPVCLHGVLWSPSCPSVAHSQGSAMPLIVVGGALQWSTLMCTAYESPHMRSGIDRPNLSMRLHSVLQSPLCPSVAKLYNVVDNCGRCPVVINLGLNKVAPLLSIMVFSTNGKRLILHPISSFAFIFLQLQTFANISICKDLVICQKPKNLFPIISFFHEIQVVKT